MSWTNPRTWVKGELVTADLLNAHLRDNLLALKTGVGYGNSLPANPADGDEYVLVDNVQTPSYQWRLRYNALSTGNKWEYVGGTPWFKYVAAAEQISSASFVDCPTPMQVVAPRAGVYRIEMGFLVEQYDGGGMNMMGVKVGSQAVADDVVARISTYFSVSGYAEEKTAAALDVIKAQLRGNAGSGTSIYSRKWMRVTPVRLS